MRKYYYAGNQRIAMRENGSLRWLLGDHLGSTAYTVNGTIETSEVRYLPWGKDRFARGQTLTSYKITGQREKAGLSRQGLKPLADSGSWLKPNGGGGARPALADPYAACLVYQAGHSWLAASPACGNKKGVAQSLCNAFGLVDRLSSSAFGWAKRPETRPTSWHPAPG